MEHAIGFSEVGEQELAAVEGGNVVMIIGGIVAALGAISSLATAIEKFGDAMSDFGDWFKGLFD